MTQSDLPSIMAFSRRTGQQVYWFAWAVIAEYHRLTDLKNRNLFPTVPETGIPRSRWQQNQCLVGLLTAVISLSVHMTSSLCVCEEKESSLVSFFIRMAILLDQYLTFITSFNLNYFQRGLIFKYRHTRVKVSTYEFGDTFSLYQWVDSNSNRKPTVFFA